MNTPKIIVLTLAACFVALIGWGIYGDIEHHKYLEAHGCQLYFKAETGRTYMSGKTQHYERVYVYECADGRKVELD